MSDHLYCHFCSIQLNSQQQWIAHLDGGKHLRNKLLKNGTSLVTSKTNTSFMVKLPNGAYSCSVCDDFVCTGIIPMNAHLAGQRHMKSIFRWEKKLEQNESQLKKLIEPEQETKPQTKSVEQRVKDAWNHGTLCSFEYDQSIASLGLERQLEALNPHFAFISKDESIPELNLYFD